MEHTKGEWEYEIINEQNYLLESAYVSVRLLNKILNGEINKSEIKPIKYLIEKAIKKATQ